MKEKVSVNFKLHPDKRELFKTLLVYDLRTDYLTFFEAFVDYFIEDWKTPSKNKEITQRYGKKLPKEFKK